MGVRRGGSGLFLIEILLALLFFMLSSAICIQLFLAARNMSVKTADLNNAVIKAQNLAECLKASGGDLKRTAELAGAHLENETIRIFFDENWDLTEIEGAFCLELGVFERSGGVTTVDIFVSKADEVLLSFQASVLEAPR